MAGSLSPAGEALKRLFELGYNLIEDFGYGSRPVVHRLPERGKLAFDRSQLVGQVEASEHGCPGRVEIARAPGNLGHQLVHFLSELDGVARVARGTNRINLVEDVDSDGLLFRLVRSFHLFAPSSLLTGAEQVHLPQQLFDAALDVLTLVTQMRPVFRQAPELGLRFR